jgi:CheY-like chemotaxis protein
MMPGMDGMEAVRRIRAIDGVYAGTVPIIALTANAVAGNESLFTDNGFQAFLPKPINRAKLDSVIRQWLMNGGPAPERADTAPDPSPEGDAVEIPGVDARRGMYLFENNMKMYTRFLRSFADNIPAELDKLRAVCGQTLPDYAIDVHTVKGAAAGIGADALSERANRLQHTAKSGDLSGVLLDNEAFLREADTLVADIQAWLTKQK